MMLLSPMERDLLDFLCCCAAKRIRVTKIHESRAESLDRLRDAQQIERDGFEPFPWALEAWRARQANQTTARKNPEPMEPPKPTAGEGGDAVLCSDAGDKHAAGIVEAASLPAKPSNVGSVCRAVSDEPAPETLPPSAPAHVSGAELAAEIEAFCQDRRITTSRFGKICLKGRGGIVKELKARSRPSDEIVARVRAAIADPPAELFADGRRQRRANFERSFDEGTMDRLQRSGARRADAVRKSIHRRAMARIEAGIPANISAGVQVKLAQEGILRQMEEDARLADPIEKAKTLLRRRYCPVISAETTGGPAGKFVVGRKLVDKQELFAMAKAMAA